MSARDRGLDGLSADAHDTIARIVGPVAISGWARQQVKKKPDEMTSVIEYAQHAVAACCRDCVAKWHGIPNEKPLSPDSIDYLSKLVTEYLEQRLPRDVLGLH
jgi:exodeoxyribonuclease V alpha subunit